MLPLCSRAAHIKESSNGTTCLSNMCHHKRAHGYPPHQQAAATQRSSSLDSPQGAPLTQRGLRVGVHQQDWPRTCGRADPLEGSRIVLQALRETGHPRGVLRRIKGGPIRLQALPLAPADVLAQQLGCGLRTLCQLLAPLHLLRAEEGLKGAVSLQVCLDMPVTARCCAVLCPPHPMGCTQSSTVSKSISKERSPSSNGWSQGLRHHV